MTEHNRLNLPPEGIKGYAQSIPNVVRKGHQGLKQGQGQGDGVLDPV